jgi:DNA replication protein DnaC
MKEAVREKLMSMNLKGVLKAYEEQNQSSQYVSMTFDERFSLLVEEEHLRRYNNRLKRNHSSAKLPVSARIEDLEFREDRKLDKVKIMELSNCSWISSSNNIAITGATGCGKTFLASALSEAALRKNYKVRYYKTHELIVDYRCAVASNLELSFMAELQRNDVIIFDEWLRDNFNLEESRLILDILDKRFRSSSSIFVSQLSVEKWHSRLGAETTISDAIMDRIIHDSHRVLMSGESMRKSSSSLVN